MELVPRRFADTLVLRPVGRIDHPGSVEFQKLLAPHLAGCAAGKDALVLDLSALEYVSSAGLRVFMLAARQAKGQQGRLVIADLQDLVKEIFEISGFTEVFETFPSVRDALGAVSPAALKDFESA
jgi:anti-anti-sigma factor